ncbi:hypothetical protein FOA52_015343 [Chlamydomonas sp. UWO 241]|nr:hypothetical protein FOA52_015343 [Chlamydomonas sp. UWO 241]
MKSRYKLSWASAPAPSSNSGLPEVTVGLGDYIPRHRPPPQSTRITRATHKRRAADADDADPDGDAPPAKKGKSQSCGQMSGGAAKATQNRKAPEESRRQRPNRPTAAANTVMPLTVLLRVIIKGQLQADAQQVVVSRPEDGSGQIAMRIMEPMLSLIKSHTLHTCTMDRSSSAALPELTMVLVQKAAGALPPQAVVSTRAAAPEPAAASAPVPASAQSPTSADDASAAAAGSGVQPHSSPAGDRLDSALAHLMMDAGSDGHSGQQAVLSDAARAEPNGSNQAALPKPGGGVPTVPKPRGPPPKKAQPPDGAAVALAGGSNDVDEDRQMVTWNSLLDQLDGQGAARSQAVTSKQLVALFEGRSIELPPLLLLRCRIEGVMQPNVQKAQGMRNRKRRAADADDANDADAAAKKGRSQPHGQVSSGAVKATQKRKALDAQPLAKTQRVKLGTYGNKQDAAHVYDFAVLSLRGVDTQKFTNFDKGAYLGDDGALLQVEAALPGLGREQHNLVRDRLAAAMGAGDAAEGATGPLPQAPQPQQAHQAGGPPHDYRARSAALVYLRDLKDALDYGAVQPPGYQEQYNQVMADLHML